MSTYIHVWDTGDLITSPGNTRLNIVTLFGTNVFGYLQSSLKIKHSFMNTTDTMRTSSRYVLLMAPHKFKCRYVDLISDVEFIYLYKSV